MPFRLRSTLVKGNSLIFVGGDREWLVATRRAPPYTRLGLVNDHLTLNRPLVIRDVFARCVDARLDFNAALARCARKGWPDKKDAIDTAFRVAEAALRRLRVRVDFLVQQGASADADWNSYTSTALVQTRVQDHWTDKDESGLSRNDPEYVALNLEIEELTRLHDAAGNAAQLEKPYEMAMRDPELIAAGWELNNKVWKLDEQLRKAG